MTTDAIESFYLSIGDIIEITFENFYYKRGIEGKQKTVEFDWNKKGEEGWVHCPVMRGSYCGCNYKQEIEVQGQLNIIKIRASKPVNMGSAYRNYITFAPSQIVGMTMVLKNPKPNVLDRIGQTLTMQKTINEN